MHHKQHRILRFLCSLVAMFGIVSFATAEEFHIQGRTLALEGNFTGSIAAYSKALALAPTRADIFFWRGIAYNALDEGEDDSQQALADWGHAVELYTVIIATSATDNPTVADAYLGRGRVSDALGKSSYGDLSAALNLYTTIIEADPENAYAYYQRGLVYRLLGDDEENSIGDYERAAELDPGLEEKIKLDHFYVLMYALRSMGETLNIYNQVIEEECRGSVFLCSMSDIEKAERLWGGQPLTDACRYISLMGDASLPTMVDHLNTLKSRSGRQCPQQALREVRSLVFGRSIPLGGETILLIRPCSPKPMISIN